MRSIKVYEMDTNNFDLIANSYFNNDIIMIFQNFSCLTTEETKLLKMEEQKYIPGYKSKYFRDRYLQSRLTIKKIFSYLFREESASSIDLTKSSDGRIMVNGRGDIFLSLSYSRNLISVSIARQKIGSDIEYIRPFYSEFLSRSPVYKSLESQYQIPETFRALGMWTLIEAISKYDERSISSLLNHPYDISDIDIYMDIINQKFFFTLVTQS
jgi:phosphopantetheinyl transferase